MSPPWLVRSQGLHARVRAFMDETRADDFDTLAVDIARFQLDHVAPLQKLLEAEGRTVADLRTAADVPALPAEVFRLRRIAVHAATHDEALFRTSGTTAEARGEHPLRTTATYAHGAVRFGRAMLWPDRERLRFIGLVAPPALAPDSSLTFMLARFAEALGGIASWHIGAGGAVDLEGLRAACRAAVEAGEPALLAGTSFAFVHVCDAAVELSLPAGSRVMQTGGFKGRSREIAPDALRAAIAARFAIPEAHVVAEYGMTELSSQLYEGTLAHGPEPARRYHAPRWLRVDAVDGETLAPLPRGARGLARFVDLANVDSSVAVLTADEIVVHDDGSVELFGRAPGATPRGCSLALEHLL